MILLPLLLLFLLHFTNSFPALPPTPSSSSGQFKPGQIFAGDQLPPELQKAPIVQPPSRSFVSSFSGYSFDYTPGITKDPSFSSPAPPPNPPDPSNPYDQPLPPPAPFSSSQSPSRDAFLLRPSPAEQFLPILPPPSLPAKPANELARFLPPPDSQKPKLTGWVLGIHQPPERFRQFPGGQAIVDPAAYFMEGADLSRVRPPRCSLIGCKGPVPNDSDFQLEQEMSTEMADRSCHRTFVPLNGCMDGRGYPVGMICSICCECSAELAAEMRKSRGWIQGYRQPRKFLNEYFKNE